MLQYQTRRTELEAKLVVVLAELNEAQTRFEKLASGHTLCTWNCSVIRARTYYERRAQHEHVVDSESRQIESIEARLRAVKKDAYEGHKKMKARASGIHSDLEAVLVTPVATRAGGSFHQADQATRAATAAAAAAAAAEKRALKLKMEKEEKKLERQRQQELSQRKREAKLLQRKEAEQKLHGTTDAKERRMLKKQEKERHKQNKMLKAQRRVAKEAGRAVGAVSGSRTGNSSLRAGSKTSRPPPPPLGGTTPPTRTLTPNASVLQPLSTATLEEHNASMHIDATYGIERWRQDLGFGGERKSNI